MVILILIFFIVIHISEWYIVGVQQDYAAYPFNGEGPVPYYYKTPQLYSSVQLFSGLLELILMSFLIWSLIKKKKQATFITIGLTFLMLFLLFVQSNIGVN